MNNSTRTIKIPFSLLCGGWFLLTSWLWAYWANVFISFPFGLLGILLWRSARQDHPTHKALKVSLILHILGLLTAIVSLLLILLNN